MLTAIGAGGEVTGQGSVREKALAVVEQQFALLIKCVLNTHRTQAFLDNVARFFWMVLKVLGKDLRHDRGGRAVDFRVHQLDFGLALKLWIWMLDAYDGGYGFQGVASA